MCKGRALDRVTKQKHRPNRQKLSQKCPKIVFSVPSDKFWTFSNIFKHFSDILSTFPFSGLSNDIPVTSLNFLSVYYRKKALEACSNYLAKSCSDLSRTSQLYFGCLHMCIMLPLQQCETMHLYSSSVLAAMPETQKGRILAILSIIVDTRFAIPPVRQRSQNWPRAQKSKRSLRKSLKGSLRVSRRTPQKSQKRVSRRLCESNLSVFDSGDSFLTLFGGSVGTPGDSLRDSLADSFLTFGSGGGFRLLCLTGGTATLGHHQLRTLPKDQGRRNSEKLSSKKGAVSVLCPQR